MTPEIAVLVVLAVTLLLVAAAAVLLPWWLARTSVSPPAGGRASRYTQPITHTGGASAVCRRAATVHVTDDTAGGEP